MLVSTTHQHESVIGIYQFSSVAQSCLTLCDPMNRSMPGLPVHHQLPEFTQTHVHRVSDVIQPSHPLSSSSPPAPNPSQHQGLFQWVNSSHELAKVLIFSSHLWVTLLLLFSCSVMSDSFWPHELQYARLSCSLPIPRACSNSCPSSQWCHPTISYSVFPFSSCLQSFPASGPFPMGGQNIGVSASASVLPMNIQDWFPLGLTGLILQSKGLSRVFSNTTVQRHGFFGTQLCL